MGRERTRVGHMAGEVDLCQPQQRYFVVRLAGELPLTLFVDWIGGAWYSHRGAGAT
jgi:hypothetical protein